MRTLASALMVGFITWIAYGLQLKAFVVGFLFLLLVLPIAFQWGLFEASVASVLSFLSLDYFFTFPLFSLYIPDRQDCVALSVFETIVLVVSRLAGRLRRQASEMAAQQARVDRLYKMSRDLLLIDRSAPVGAELVRLIAEAFATTAVALWEPAEAKLFTAGAPEFSEDESRSAYLFGTREDDAVRGRHIRALSLGDKALGALCIRTGPGERIDERTADAIASLVAIAMERERAFAAESSAEASRQSEQLRSAVLDGLAHAYKTPLATIQTASSGLLELNRLAAVEMELVTVIQSEVEHLSALTTQALQTARIDDLHLKVRPERIPLKAFLHSDWGRLAQGLKHHELKIETEKAGRVVWADPKLLQMALAQFLDNATKYAAPASTVSLRVTATDSEAIFSVHNRGSFILPEDRERIFQRFYRAAASRHRTPGTGIGLSVVKQIAEAHHGQVWMESDRETGTTFYLRLPNLVRGDR